MATLETQILDDIIVKSRRKMLSLGGAALAGLVVGAGSTKAEAQSATYTDNDILNFALNLEYLEANFYYLAAFGCTINTPNAAAIAAGAPSAGIPITITGGGVGTAGTVNTTGANQVPFGATTTGTTVGSYATETAIEEGKHVLALQAALGTLAANQPAINLSSALWNSLGGLATSGAVTTFSPYLSNPFFLIGAYVFEDVGVTAYHGAAALLTGTTTTLPVAAGILAVEAYHAGLVRTTINSLDPNNTNGYLTLTNQVSALRATLAAQGTAASTFDPSPDDFGLMAVGAGGTTLTPPTVSLAGTTAVSATRLVDVDLSASDPTNSIAIARTTNQVLNIVCGGSKVSAGGTVTPTATGLFFPAGLNAGANGFK
ncbi:ferritin-like domain-containing protein [Granulicella paludicola]|uniref:ferritin-like domain-containing protein n=1 Tax=Granulicella paludicola TaxID=474951 RepID=UPI0021E0BC99|nr:ferritin-like domain-containing protein [Granulicella paludicola]